MSHGYALRTGLDGDAAQRAARMEAQGWHVARPDPNTVLAWQGAGAHHRVGPLSYCGLVFLDNRAALCAALELSEGEAAPLSDLALLARAHAARGADVGALVSGSFSVVVHDHDTGAVEGWRDHFGVYPFHYTQTGGTLCAGSDLRAVLHLSGLALQPDATRIADFICGQVIDRDATAFTGLACLPAAHHLRASEGAVTVTRYWEPALPPLQPAEGAPARLRAALAAATAARTGAGTGAMLSGGLDSTTLAGLAAQSAKAQGLAPLRTLSFVHGTDKAYDESGYIDEANAAFGTDGHAISVTAAPELAAMGPMVEEQMDLFQAAGLQKSRRIYAEARELGLSALLDGHGGDEVISHGYARLVELAARGSWGRLFVEARGAARVHGTPVWGIYLGHIVQYGGLPQRSLRRRAMAWIGRRLARGQATRAGTEQAMALIALDLGAQVDAQARYAPKPAFATEDARRDAARLSNLEEVSAPLVERGFEVLHRSATAAGVLPLYPFFDHRVIAECLAMPAETKLRDGQTRWVLREAMRGLLPESVRSRPDKAAFNDELAEAVRAYYQALGPDPFRALAPWVDPERAEALCTELRAGRLKDAFALRALWRLALLLHWSEALTRWQRQQAEGTLI